MKNYFTCKLIFLFSICFIFVSCSNKSLQSISVTPINASIYIGETQQYTAIGIYSDGSTQNITSFVKWYSSDPAIATIASSRRFTPIGVAKNGFATGVSLGSTLITAKFRTVTSNAVTLTVPPQFGYVANIGTNNILRCAVNIITGQFSSCMDSAYPFFLNPAGIAFAMHRIDTQSYVYVANNNLSMGTTVAQCTVNPLTGLFEECADSGFLFGAPAGISLHTPKDKTTYAYVVNNTADTVTKCALSPLNGKFESCIDSGFILPAGGSTFSLALIEFHTSNNQSYAYVTDGVQGQPYVIKCTVESSGQLSDCQIQVTATGLVGSMGIAFTKIDDTDYAYVVQGSSSFGGIGNGVSRCNVNAIDGALIDCVDAGGSGFMGPWDIDIVKINGELFGYISNFGGGGGTTVIQCKIDPTTKDLSCTDSGAGPAFGGPIGIDFW